MKKVRLFAMAKDEGAYLAEWIFYHLNLGFDSILIYVNNTSDNSIEILSKISKHYPNVLFEVVDGVEKSDINDKLICPAYLSRNPLQSRGYAKAYTESSPKEADYLMCMDIDEFFYLAEYQNLNEYLTTKKFDFKRYRWFNIAGEKSCFGKLAGTLIGENSNYTKFIIRTGLQDFRFETSHCIEAKLFDLSPSDDGIILHRNLRSKEEYISMLGKGDLYNNAMNGFKRNRKGWSKKGKHKLVLNRDVEDFFAHKLPQMISEVDISSELEVARKFALDRVKLVEKNVKEVKSLNKDLDRILNGTGLIHHYDSALSFIKSAVRNRTINVNRH